MTHPDESMPRIDDARFRHVLGHFASGVVVVTAETGDGPVGITCQSFSSLSLDPPLVLFCTRKSSWAWSRIRRAGHFCVNILDERQEGLAQAFASRTASKFAGVAYDRGRSGAPVLGAAMGWVDCTLHAVHEGGDHDIVVGRVLDLEVRLGPRPLLVYRGGFERLAC